MTFSVSSCQYIDYIITKMKKVFEGLVEEFEKRPNHVEEAFKIASERYHLTPYQINDISPAYAR